MLHFKMEHTFPEAHSWVVFLYCSTTRCTCIVPLRDVLVSFHYAMHLIVSFHYAIYLYRSTTRSIYDILVSLHYAMYLYIFTCPCCSTITRFPLRSRATPCGHCRPSSLVTRNRTNLPSSDTRWMRLFHVSATIT